MKRNLKSIIKNLKTIWCVHELDWINTERFVDQAKLTEPLVHYPHWNCLPLSVTWLIILFIRLSMTTCRNPTLASWISAVLMLQSFMSTHSAAFHHHHQSLYHPSVQSIPGDILRLFIVVISLPLLLEWLQTTCWEHVVFSSVHVGVESSGNES